MTEIQIFSTVICTADNKTILLPNGSLSTGSINNWSKQDYRRVQWDVGISYGDDFKTARASILSILDSTDGIVRPGNVDGAKTDAEAAKAVETRRLTRSRLNRFTADGSTE